MVKARLSTRYGYVGGEDIYDLERYGWTLVSAWGADGWDIGDWPIHGFAYKQDGEVFTAAEYCEHDLTEWDFATAAEMMEHLDWMAETYWRCFAKRGPDLSAYPEGELPDKFKGPFAWGRVTI